MRIEVEHPTDRPNFYRVDIENGDTFTVVWYSYRTPIAFKQNGMLVIRENEWGPTTGKHLNFVAHSEIYRRVTGGAFEAAFARATL